MSLRHSRCVALAWSLLVATGLAAQEPSIARVWNEALLEAIREDFARPTVHARNLYHLSLAAHEVYAAYDEPGGAQHLLLGETLGEYSAAFDGVAVPSDPDAALREAISYASYRLLRYRFRNSPGRSETYASLDALMVRLGYDVSVSSVDYADGRPATLGNYVANQLIRYGLTDGSNDEGDYANLGYETVNPPLLVDQPGNPDIEDPDRWQPLSLTERVDQAGNPLPGGAQDFLGPEWGWVTPFALDDADAEQYERGGVVYTVYHDPGPPPLITDDATRERYQRGFEMVVRWSSLLDPADGVVWDVSPGARGRHVDPLPEAVGYYDYYEEYEGGDSTGGLRQNPVTGEPYAPNLVPRADFARVLAEFWADGPDSETPPGHWFTILNYVLEQPELSRRWRGQGPELDPLAYDIRAYLALGGAMHDAAISTWSVKGRYDYLRPVSAIRYMAERGQRTDPDLPNYHPHGFELEEGYVELIAGGDPLAGIAGQHVGEVKVWAWRGPEAVGDPEDDVAGVGWVRAREWWPYQRPTFVSPPFAGYVSGHSTFSRAAADVLTDVTGSPYFPGGLGSFTAEAGEFLVFEDGPSETVELEWASYRDAADESGLSRIFGGIHPPCDDVPGRRIGGRVAHSALVRANELFDVRAPTVTATASRDLVTEDDVGGEGVTVRLLFSEAIDSASFTWALPDDLPDGLLAVVREGWVDGLTRRNYEIEFEVLPLGGELYNGVYLRCEARDLAGNVLPVPRTEGLFGLGRGASSVARESRATGGGWGVTPNPTRANVTVTGPRSGLLHVYVTDAVGRVVRRWTDVSVGLRLDVRSLPRGMYSVRIEGGGGAASAQVLMITE